MKTHPGKWVAFEKGYQVALSMVHTFAFGWVAFSCFLFRSVEAIHSRVQGVHRANEFAQASASFSIQHILDFIRSTIYLT